MVLRDDAKMRLYRWVWTRNFTISVYVTNINESPSKWHFQGVLRDKVGKFLYVRYNKDDEKLVGQLENLFNVQKQ